MKVVVVAAYPLVRQGLVSILTNQNDIQLSGEAATEEEALIVIDKIIPDIVIVDANLGCKSGLDLIIKARQQNLAFKFILLGIYENKRFIFDSIKVGVEGHILREAPSDEIIYAIHQVYKGKKYYDSDLFKYMSYHEREKEVPDITPREREILVALGKGLSNRQIAKDFCITENTVKKHIGNILSKLNLHDRVQAAIFVNNKMFH